MGDIVVLVGYVAYLMLLVLFVMALAAFAASMIEQLTAVPEPGHWPVDARPSRDVVMALTSKAHWDDQYVASYEEIASHVPPTPELPADSEFLAFTEPPGCDECHLPVEEMYPSGDPMKFWHIYQETHSDTCDCCTCHRPPHPVTDKCSCCDCHGCWTTGWSVEKELITEQCVFCHPGR